MSEGTIKILGAILLAAIVFQGIRVISNKMYEPEGEQAATEQAAPAKPAEGAPAEAKPETPAPAAAPAKEAAAPAPAPAPRHRHRAAAPAAAAAGDADAGSAVFKGHLCFACHSFEAGHNGAGPSLAGVFGRKAGQAPGFAYSDGVKNSGITWNEESIGKWVQGPQAVVPDAKMMLAKPVTDPKERADLIAYIKRESAKAAGQ